MKSIAGPLVAAIVTALIGGGFWMMGQNDRRLGDVHAQLVTLRYAGAETQGGDVEEALGPERRVPMVGPTIVADVRDARATAGYWRGDYAAIGARKDANGVVTETNPEILLLTANAAYRGSQSATEKNELVRRLDAVVKAYGEVLKAPTADCAATPQVCEARAMDAAYNYEFAIRTRELTAKQKAPLKSPAARAVLKALDEGDLPTGTTLHGKPGGPPPATDMNQFKIVIPKRGEERKDAPDAGKGGTKIRKG